MLLSSVDYSSTGGRIHHASDINIRLGESNPH